MNLGTFTDEEMAREMNVSLSTLKNKRKVTENIHLKNYAWTRNKKEKTYYVYNLLESDKIAFLDTFEAIICHLNYLQIDLGNREKALKILMAIHDSKSSRISDISELCGYEKKEITRYVNRFKEMELLTSGSDFVDFEYYIISPGVPWKLISKEKADEYKKRWMAETKKAFKITNLAPQSTDKTKTDICLKLAQRVVYEVFGGYLKKIEKKELTDEAKSILGPFFNYVKDKNKE